MIVKAETIRQICNLVSLFCVGLSVLFCLGMLFFGSVLGGIVMPGTYFYYGFLVSTALGFALAVCGVKNVLRTVVLTWHSVLLAVWLLYFGLSFTR